jgi:hypothetical protein
MTDVTFEITIDPGQHWMLYSRTIGIFRKTISISDLEVAKFTHTKVSRCLFSSTSESYTAIRYGDGIYRLFYDVAADKWRATRKLTFNQGAHQVDYVGESKKALHADGWTITEETI